MTNDGILRGVRDGLGLSNDDLAALFALGDQPVDGAALQAALLPIDESGTPCSHDALAGFLDALVVQRRGPRERPAPARTGPVTNNQVLKKLRAALQMHEPQVLAVLAAGGRDSSPKELRGIFRQDGHKDFRACPDGVLAAFFVGLAASADA